MKKNLFELDVVSVRLVRDSPLISNHKITSSVEAVDVLGELLCDMDREMVCVVNLKTDGTPINCHFASMGALAQSLVHPRELFKASILSNAAKMILLHNHPSGSPHPSREDIRITDRILQVGKLMDIPLIDHIIIGAGNNREYFSFAEKSLLQNPCYSYETDLEKIEFDKNLKVAEGESRGR